MLGDTRDRSVRPIMSIPSRPLESPVRLALADIFVWMSLACVVTALWIQHHQGDIATVLSPRLLVFFVPVVFAFSTAGTALCYFLRNWWRGDAIDFQPGHWLLCLTGVILGFHIVMVALKIAVRKFIVPVEEQLAWLSHLQAIGHETMFIIVFLVAGFVLPVRCLWRWVLVMPCLLSMVNIAIRVLWSLGQPAISGVWPQILFDAQVLIMALGIFVLLAISAWDQATTMSRRDVLHWLGVFSVLLLNLPILLLRIESRFF